MNQTSVDSYLRDGCGRCDDYQTPQCKVHAYPEVLRELRAALQSTALEETMKWGGPCYTLDGRNVVNLGALRGYCAVGFFKGV